MNATVSRLALSLACAALLSGAACTPRVAPPDFADLAERASPSVVNISTVSRGRAGDTQLPEALEESPFGDWFHRHFEENGGESVPEDMESLGSGFVLWSDGYILTNRHVVSDADEIVVRLLDRRQLPATVVGIDERSDLALLHIDATDLPVVKIGDSDKLRVGQWVLAIGSPFGFDHTVTSGIVSAKGRALATEQYVPYIQTDVAINQGNSGGPLFNLDGEVIGINSQIYSQTGGYMGISFAIPIDVAIKVARQLRDGGQVARGWLGVVVQEVTRPLAQSFGMSKPEGALVSRVMPNSPAEKAGVRIGDVILKFNEQVLARSDALPPLVGNVDPGDHVRLDILRDGRRTELDVTVGELSVADADSPALEPEPVETPTGTLGMRVAPLSGDDRDRAQVPSGGVVVTEISRGAARDAGLREGDVLLSIAGSEIDSPARLEEVITRLTPGQSVPVLVQRRGAPLFLALQVPRR